MLVALAEAALHTVLLIALVKLGLCLLRIKRTQLLLVTWTVILAASLAMPALQWVTPLRMAVFPDLPSTILIGAADPQPQPRALEALGPALAADVKEPTTIRPWLEAVYLLVSSFLFLRLTVGVVLSLRLLGEATPVPLDWAKSGHVRISRYVTAPVTVARTILLPADAVDWPPTMRRAVLAHEHAHVVRWDFAMLLLSQVNRALFWFSPLSWWLHRRLVALAELASDDYAMEITGDRPGYAEVLLQMGRRSGPVLRGVAMARPATLQYRIERILAERVRPAPVSPVQQVILAVSALALSIAVASSELSIAPPSDVPVLIEQSTPPTTADALPSGSAQVAEVVPESRLLPQPETPMPLEAPPHVTASILLELPIPISRPHPNVRVPTRPQVNPVARSAPVAQASHVTRHSTDNIKGGVELEALQGPKPIDSEATLPRDSADLDQTNSSDGNADEQRRAPRSHPVTYSIETDRPVLRLVDNRTCSGVYMPEHSTASVKEGLNLIPAILLRDANHSTFLTFFLGGQKFLVQPVTVKQERDKLTKIPNTIFTMLPTAARHLNGFIKRPYGRIDFDCGGTEAASFDGGS